MYRVFLFFLFPQQHWFPCCLYLLLPLHISLSLFLSLSLSLHISLSPYLSLSLHISLSFFSIFLIFSFSVSLFLHFLSPLIESHLFAFIVTHSCTRRTDTHTHTHTHT